MNDVTIEISVQNMSDEDFKTAYDLFIDKRPLGQSDIEELKRIFSDGFIISIIKHIPRKS